MADNNEKASTASSVDGSKDTGSKPDDNSDIHQYPTGLKFALLMVSIFTGMFLVSLDRLIISTAIPAITNQFNSAGDVGWYGTAYMLTGCAFQLVFGKIYIYFSIRNTFLASVLLFEVGSALCGAAPNSIALIFGRAIAGLGSGGVQSGVITIIVYAVPLHKRPIYQGFFGAIFGISSVLGPLLGGVFTTDVTWRWCFYINLPLGAVVMVLAFFLIQIPERPNTKIPLQDKIKQLNILGLLPLVPGVVCLCLALQWGGTTYAWSNGRVIAVLVLAFVLLIVFILIQVWLPDQATVPPKIFIQRSIASGFWAIQGVSAAESGVHLLPMLISVVVASIVAGQLVSRIGYYTPFLILGVCFSSIGAGLLTTLSIHTPTGQWIGYQILYGFGLGLSSQAPNMAAQTVLPRPQVPIGASLMFFAQQLFGAIFISVGQNALDNQLVRRLAGIPTDPGVGGITAQLIQSSGATAVLGDIPAAYRIPALQAYNDALRACFQIGLIMACIAIIGALGMEWRSVKKNNPAKKLDSEAAGEERDLRDSKNESPTMQGGARREKL